MIRFMTWEYLIEDSRDRSIDMQERFNQLGKEGWELVCHHSYHGFIFRRAVIDEVTAMQMGIQSEAARQVPMTLSELTKDIEWSLPLRSEYNPMIDQQVPPKDWIDEQIRRAQQAAPYNPFPGDPPKESS